MKCTICGAESFPRIGQYIDKTTVKIQYQCSNVNCFNPDTVTRPASGLTPEESAVVKKIRK